MVIYQKFEFIDLNVQYVNFKDDNIILDFANSIVINETDYLNFIECFRPFDINANLSEIFYIVDKILKANNYSDVDYLYFVDTIYILINNTNSNYFKELQIFKDKPLIYFLALLLINHVYQSHNTYDKHRDINLKKYWLIRNNQTYTVKNIIDIYRDAKIIQDSINKNYTIDDCILLYILPFIDRVEIDNCEYSTVEYVRRFYHDDIICTSLRKNIVEFDIICKEQNLQIILPHFYYMALDYKLSFSFIGSITENCEILFFMLYSFFLLPRRKNDEDIIIELLNHCKNNLVFLPNIFYDSYLHYKKNITINSNDFSALMQCFNINLEFNIQDVIEYKPYHNNIIRFYDNSNKYCTFYNYYRTLLNNINYNELGIYCNENMCKKQLANRIYSFVNHCSQRIDLNIEYNKNNSIWLAVNSDSLIKYAKNKNDLTPSALIARNLEGYEEYANETNLDLWKEDTSIYLLHRHNNKYCGHSINQLINAVDSQKTLLSCNNDYHFKNNEIEDLQNLLIEINSPKTNNLLQLVNVVLNNQKYTDLQHFKSMTNKLTTSQMQLMKEYFMCYFYLLNYLRFWPGPGSEIKVREVNKHDARIYMRNEIVSYFMPVIQEYREELATTLGENWDKDILLMSKPYSILAVKNEEIYHNGNITCINMNSLHGRLVLLSRNLFCSAIYCENAMLYINAITSYLSLNVTKNNTRKILQQLSNETMSAIFQRMLNHNLYYQHLHNKSNDNDNIIFTNMLNYYNYNKNSNYLLLPTFVEEENLTYKDNKIYIPSNIFQHNSEHLGFKINHNYGEYNINNIYAEMYQYYFALYNYFTITNFLTSNIQQDVGNINQYINIYHTLNFEDSNKITHYYNFL